MNNKKIFIFISKMIEKFKFYLINNIKAIIHVVLFSIWIILFFLGYITIQRLIIFVLILCVAFLYRKSIEYLNELKNISYGLVIFLINIDRAKLLFINIIMCMYIFLFDLLDKVDALEIKYDKSIMSDLTIKVKVALFMEWAIKGFLINPFLALLHKYYKLLHIWVTTPFKQLMLGRFYGIILAVLVFTPIYSYVWVLFKWNWLYIYMLFIVISLLDDNAKKLVEVKYVKYLAYGVSLLNLDKNLAFVLECRNKTSIFAILIKKGLDRIMDRNSKINKYAYYINIIYVNVLPMMVGTEEGFQFGKKVMDYDIFLMRVKVVEMRENLIMEYGSFLRSFCINALHPYWALMNISNFIYYWKYQEHCTLDAADLIRVEKLIEICYLLIKLPVFYSWNLSKLNGVSNFELLNYLKIPREYPFYEFAFDEGKVLKNAKSKHINKIIRNADFYVHRDFYEQALLYSDVWEFYCYKNKGIKSNQYEHINAYIDIFKDLTIAISDDKLELMDWRPDKWEEAIYSDLEIIKKRLVEEWAAQAVDLSIENFYKKNNDVLNELNSYVKNEVKYYKKSVN